MAEHKDRGEISQNGPMEEKKEEKDQQFDTDNHSLLPDASRGWRMTLGAGALSRE